ncbi:hypothetical protein N7456_002352 [Penicillium angulare]|uniref:Uncharacterized protein n=1 Tax=Penicillium angulare TaxID=116970 RepID=A0A9W9KQ87_9EURO|nr:hypothetical protein N7456_002352 [Penicillium angulare]
MVCGGGILIFVCLASACVAACVFARDSVQTGWVHGSNVLWKLFETITNPNLDFPDVLFTAWQRGPGMSSSGLSHHMRTSRWQHSHRERWAPVIRVGFGEDAAMDNRSSGSSYDSSIDSFGYDRESLYDDELLFDRGQDVSRWLEDPGIPTCPISRLPRDRLTREQLEQVTTIDLETNRGSGHMDQWINLMLRDLHYSSRSPLSNWRINSRDNSGGHVHMTTREGLIVLDYVFRPEGNTRFPHVSSIVNLLYQTTHSTTPLSYILVTNVGNHNTLDYLQSFNEGWHTWTAEDNDTFNEYHMALGTRIGRLAGYIAIEAYPQGTHRISAIHLFRDMMDGADSLRFDISPAV